MRIFSVKNLFLLLVFLVLSTNLAIGTFLFRQELQQANRGKSAGLLAQLGTFMRAYRLIQGNFVDRERTGSQELISNAINGMARQLDPYSEYLPPRENALWQELSDGQFGGIGMSIIINEGLPTIISTQKDSPAYSAGLLSGDKLLAIDGHPTVGKDMNTLLQELHGEPGTKLTLTIERKDEPAPLKFTVTRDIIKLESIAEPCLIEQTTIGYLRILQFNRNTPEEVRQALADLISQGAQSFIIDLRGNPGGLLFAAVDICSFFLPEGIPVVSIEGRHENKNETLLSKDSVLKLPFSVRLAVLIDRGSASASEITAGCLQDHKRAILVGTQSFGKGCVQDFLPLEEGSALKLTVALYYTPNHQVIEKHGLKPDVEVTMTQEEYLRLTQTNDFKQAIPLDMQLQEAIRLLSLPQEEGINNTEPQETK